MSDAARIIIGTGHAGYTLAREFRKLDEAAPLLLISADDGTSYYKPNLSKALAMGKDAAALAQFTAEQMAETLNAEIRVNSRVEAIDPAAKTIQVDGETIPYASLVLATGAEPIRLGFEGDAASEVISVNNLADYAGFRERLAEGSRVLLIGAGLIGCEFANDLAAAGHSVTAVDLAQWPLPQLLPQACGEALQHGLESLGVKFRLQQSVQAVHSAGNGYRVTFSDGDSAEFDLVLSAVGLRPHSALAQAAGLHCERGVVVDDHLRSSDPDIYALGDVAQIAGRLMPYILPIAHGARALAQTLAGTPTPAKLPAMPVMVKTPACPVVVCPPPPEAEGQWQVNGEAPNLDAGFVNGDGEVLGFALTGEGTKLRGQYASKVPAVL